MAEDQGVADWRPAVLATQLQPEVEAAAAAVFSAGEPEGTRVLWDARATFEHARDVISAFVDLPEADRSRVLGVLKLLLLPHLHPLTIAPLLQMMDPAPQAAAGQGGAKLVSGDGAFAYRVLYQVYIQPLLLARLPLWCTAAHRRPDLHAPMQGLAQLFSNAVLRGVQVRPGALVCKMVELQRRAVEMLVDRHLMPPFGPLLMLAEDVRELNKDMLHVVTSKEYVDIVETAQESVRKELMGQLAGSA